MDVDLSIYLDKSMYSKNAVIKTVYWFSDLYSINLEEKDSNYVVNFNRKLGNDVPDDSLHERFLKEVNDFNLREIIITETKPIRELIIAKAFSHGEYDEDPPGELDDPIGFKKI